VEPFRQFGSVTYFDQIISKASDFELRDCCYSMNVLIRRGQSDVDKSEQALLGSIS
jgi:hypothetical protein